MPPSPSVPPSFSPSVPRARTNAHARTHAHSAWGPPTSRSRTTPIRSPTPERCRPPSKSSHPSQAIRVKPSESSSGQAIHTTEGSCLRSASLARLAAESPGPRGMRREVFSGCAAVEERWPGCAALHAAEGGRRTRVDWRFPRLALSKLIGKCRGIRKTARAAVALWGVLAGPGQAGQPASLC